MATTAKRSRPADHEADAAEHILSAFGQMRHVAVGLRRRGDRSSAAEIERVARALVDTAAPVKASYARRRLGISDPTLREWVARGILERSGERPLRVTLGSLAQAEIETRRARADDSLKGGRGMTDVVERHLKWQRTLESESFQRALRELAGARPPQDHRTAEQRSVALHEAIGDRLNDESVAAARRRVRRWLREGGPVVAERARKWDRLLQRPLPELREAIVQDSETMRDLRQDSPFAGVLPESERHRILRESA